MQTFKDMVGPDYGRNLDHQIRTIIDQFHRNAEQLCKEDFDRLALANGYVKAEVPITSMHDPRLTAKKTEPWHIDIDSLARSAGYVKAEDYEALKAKVAELTDLLEDATDTLDLIESEADLFDATAIASGYVKLEPGLVVVKARDAAAVLDFAEALWSDPEVSNFQSYGPYPRDEISRLAAELRAALEGK